MNNYVARAALATIILFLTACASTTAAPVSTAGSRGAANEPSETTLPGGVITYGSSFWGGVRRNSVELKSQRGRVTLEVSVEFERARPADRFKSRKYNLPKSAWKKALTLISRDKLLGWKPVLSPEPVKSDVSQSLNIRVDGMGETGHSWHSGSLTPESSKQVAHLLMYLNRLTRQHTTLHAK